jgi:hypothetical protein
MKKTSFFPIVFIALICSSCGDPTVTKQIEKTQAKESLVYIRGEYSNGQELISSGTGFVIARQDSFFTRKYFVLVAKHSTKEAGLSAKFKVVPFRFAEIHVPDRQEFINKTPIYKGSENESKLDLIAELDGIDVSVMSFDSNQELPIPFVSYHKPLPQEKLVMHGFIRCIVSNRQNKYFSYHSTDGEMADLNYINRVEQEVNYRNELLKKLENIDTEHKKEGYGIDLRYSNPSREGMSGSPITTNLNNREVIVGIQNRKLKNKDEPNTCQLDPEKAYSYGTSIDKILSARNFPENVMKLMKIERDFPSGFPRTGS